MYFFLYGRTHLVDKINHFIKYDNKYHSFDIWHKKKILLFGFINKQAILWFHNFEFKFETHVVGDFINKFFLCNNLLITNTSIHFQNGKFKLIN